VRSSSAALAPQVFTELERVFGAPVIEAYGMTEAAHQMASNPLPPGVRKPGTVGQAAGPEIAILDDAGGEAPPGVRGEVAIRGPNVTSGYLDNPEANASSFVRGWFRTGDEGTLDADGYLTLTGRLKEVINRAGEKISPREVDEALLDHPAVEQAVAFAVPDLVLGEDVAAAVVLRDGISAEAPEIREFVAQRLADFKIPRRILFLDEIPKGPTGKIQRIGLARKLGLEEPQEPTASAARWIAPRTPIESEVARIWSEVLRLEKVGASDDFFALGGDSVLAARVAARIAGALGVELSLAALFDAPTVAELAAKIESRVSGGPADREPIRPGAAGSPPVVSVVQEQLWFHEQLDPGRYNRSTNLRLQGPVDAAALQRALRRILERHEVLRSVYPTERGVAVPRIVPRGELPLARRDLSGLETPERELELARQAREEVERPLDPARGPLVRAALLKLSAVEHVLLVTAHHIAFDRWSVGVFASELAALHRAFSRGEPDPLPALPIQYADFARWERNRLPRLLEIHLPFWKRHLAGAEPLELPADRPDGDSGPARFEELRFAVPAGLVAGLSALSRRANASLFMTLLAAYQTLLFLRTAQTDLVVGSNSDKRLRIETEPLIGLFADLIVFRTDLSGAPSFFDVVARVRETALQTYRHQELPFSRIVAGLRPPRRRGGGIPFARSLFAMNTRLRPVVAGGTTFEPLEPREEAAGYELSLFLEHGENDMTGTWKYDARFFDGPTIAGLSRDYGEVLERVAKDPDVSIEALRERRLSIS
jgi:acyl carrier protein